MGRDKGLPREVADRLEAFLRRVERLSLEQMRTLAARPARPMAHDKAALEADVLSATHDRRSDLQDARKVVREWVLAAQRPSQIGQFVGVGFDQPQDRMEIARSLEDAVTALVVWDLLAEELRDELLGPWRRLAEPGR